MTEPTEKSFSVIGSTPKTEKDGEIRVVPPNHEDGGDDAESPWSGPPASEHPSRDGDGKRETPGNDAAKLRETSENEAAKLREGQEFRREREE